VFPGEYWATQDIPALVVTKTVMRYRMVAMSTDSRIHISMIMYGGLSYGGAHRQVIRLACALDRDRFVINYFWCKPNPDIHSDFVWPELDYSSIDLMRSHGINVIEFHAQTRDISNKYHRWIHTDFFRKFSKVRTDLVFASRGGYPEFPFFLLRNPVLEWNIFGCSDFSPNLVFSASISHWAHTSWKKSGGSIESAIIYPGVPDPAGQGDMRRELALTRDLVILGFHQRVDEHIYGQHALRAYAAALSRLKVPTRFVILGGSNQYRTLALELGLNVIFLPLVKDYDSVSKFLSTPDIFAHSGGAGEAHGTAIQEAMMHGLPTITMVIEGKADGQVGTMAGTGMVTYSVAEYSDAIVALVNDRVRRLSLGSDARGIAMERYAITSVVDRFEKIFAQKYREYRHRRFCVLNKVTLDYLVECMPWRSAIRRCLSLIRRKL